MVHIKRVDLFRTVTQVLLGLVNAILLALSILSFFRVVSQEVCFTFGVCHHPSWLLRPLQAVRWLRTWVSPWICVCPDVADRWAGRPLVKTSMGYAPSRTYVLRRECAWV